MHSTTQKNETASFPCGTAGRSNGLIPSAHVVPLPNIARTGRNSKLRQIGRDTATAGNEPATKPLGIRRKSATSPDERPKNAQNYRLLRLAQRFKFTHEAKTRERRCENPDRPDSVNYCQRRLPEGWGVERGNETKILVYRKRDGTAARFSGTFHCKNVWACSICSSRITSKRAQEVAEAMKRHISAGFTQGQQGKTACYMVTTTFQHTKDDKLAYILTQFLKACRRFKSGGDYQRFMGNLSLVGSIASLEVLYGGNGWHPHRHDVIFTKALTDDELHQAQEWLRARWLRVLAMMGLDGWKDIALTLTPATPTGYTAKFGADPATRATWGADKELLYGRSKKSRGISPWQILELSDTRPDYAELYREFYRCFKGKRQLFWSRGLKRRYLIPELTDAEILRETDLDWECVGALNWEQYAYLEEIGGLEGLGRFLDDVLALGFTAALPP